MTSPSRNRWSGKLTTHGDGQNILRFDGAIWKNLMEFSMDRRWNYLMPIVLCFPYYLLLHAALDPVEAFLYMTLCMIALTSFSLIQYLVDKFEVTEWQQRPFWKSSISNRGDRLILRIVICTSLLPWIIFPSNWVCYTLFVAYVFLLILRGQINSRSIAFPVFEIGQYLIQIFLMANAFYLTDTMATTVFFPFCLLFSVWLVMLIIRSWSAGKTINNKSSDDESNDQQLTFPTTQKETRLPLFLEILVFLLLLFVYLDEMPVLFSVFAFLTIWTLWNEYNIPTRARVSDYFLAMEEFLMEFTSRWMPMLILFTVVSKKVFYLPIIVMHFILFPNFLKTWVMGFLKRILKMLPHKVRLVFLGYPWRKSLALHSLIVVVYTGLFLMLTRRFMSSVETGHMVSMFEKLFKMLYFSFITTHAGLFITMTRATISEGTNLGVQRDKETDVY